jgi:hypothetical protein
MKALRNVWTLVALGALTGCGTVGESAGSDQGSTVGTASQAATLADCQKQVATCSLAAKSFADFAGCTVKFQACTTQAAADLVGEGKLLASCRTQSTACLDGALTSLDIKACRDVYTSCAKDVQASATTLLKDAVGAAQDAIDKTLTTATDTIQGAQGATSGALDALAACEKDAGTCLTAALTPNGVTVCRTSFESCVGKAEALVNKVTDPLPGPTPGQLIDGLTSCQDKSIACLKTAVTSLDITACQSSLQSCVGTATKLVDQTVNDLNGALPPVLQLPSPTKPIDCTAAASACLLQLKNPIDCATQAAACLTK